MRSSEESVYAQKGNYLGHIVQNLALIAQFPGYSLALLQTDTRGRPTDSQTFGDGRAAHMVDYIGTERLIGLVTRVGPAQFMAGLAADIEADFVRWGEFDKSARHATHSTVGVIELMPTCDGRLYSFKYVNGHPKNTAEGLLTVTAFGVLADVDTGYPLLLSEMTYATALRTAATSALAARALARPACRVMALIGNGAQSEFQAVAFHHMLGIRELRLYDTDLRATLKLERNLAMLGLPGLQVVRCSSTAQAVHGADIVTTVTADKCKAIILTPDMIAPGMHLNAIGGDCPGKTELHADILLRADARVVVEFEAQSRIEGEVQQLPSSFPVTELSAVLCGKAPGRTSERDVTIFDSVGFALEDFSTLRYLYRLQSAERGAHQQIDLVPDLEDPKNLFARLAARVNSAHISGRFAAAQRA
jgi:ornithine cyclodeaminase